MKSFSTKQIISNNMDAKMMMTRIYSCLVLVALCSGAWAEIYRVDVDADSGGDGVTWGTAFQSIQDGINAAEVDGGGEVWVAVGTYTGVGGVVEVDSAPAGECVVLLAEHVQLYGGFSGIETERSQRDWSTNLTVIDGEDTRRGVGGKQFSTLDGFFVLNGRATGPETYGDRGGGIFNFGDSGDIVNCTFMNNTADYGGGIYNHYASPTITNCIIMDNEALEHAGGIDNVTTSSPVMTNCIIAGNTAAKKGGGINNFNFSSPIMTNCTITGNIAGDFGGGVFNNTDCSPEIVNCIIWNNTDGILNIGSGSTPTVEYCCVQGGYSGDGNFSSDPLFVDSSADDFYLNKLSPCIDTGTSLGAPLTDIIGVSRPIRHGVDIGAYEFSSLLPIAIGKDLVVDLGPDGTVSIDPADIDNGSNDDLAIVNMTLSKDTFTCADIGDNSVTFTVEDADGNTDSCIVTVTVRDRIAPVLTLQGDEIMTIELGGVFNDPGALASDICDDDLSVIVGGQTVNTQVVGSYTVTYDATDSSGNRAERVTRTVNVEAVWRAVWYVNGNGYSATPNGVSWATSSRNLQAVINMAVSVGASEEHPSEIWVADGTYSGSGGVAMVDDEPSGECVVVLAQGVHLYGGFNGDEVAREQRDWVRYQAIINGGNVRRCVGGEQFSTLDGFIVRNGRAAGLETYGSRGGGIFNFGGSMDIANCTFKENTALYGAGIYNHYASPSITNCLIINNEALEHAGGIDNVTTSSPVLTNCIIAENTAVKKGGGINNFNFSSPTLINCTITGNIAGDYGGGVFNNTDCSPEIVNCIIWDNTDGVYNVGSGSIPTIKYCCVQGGYDGEGNIDGDPLLANPENGHFALSPLSPCIDAGTVDGTPDEDFLRKPRHVGASVDMGAIEFAPKTGWFIY